MPVITIRKYEKAKEVIGSILQENTFEVIKEKRSEYRRTKAPSLKIFHTLYNRYIRNIKTIQNYERENLCIQKCCDNCHRDDHDYNTNNEVYKLHLIQQDKDNIKGRKKFKDADSFANSNKETYILCKECNKYLTLTAKEINDSANIVNAASIEWCSFIWSILSNEKIHEKYGALIWRFIPLNWRPWWINSLRN